MAGIDLNKTFSFVDIFQKGKIDIFLNEIENRIISSIFSFSENKIYVSYRTSSFLITIPESIIYIVKRLIGRRYSDVEVQKELDHLLYKIINQNKKLQIEIVTQNSSQYHTSEMISSFMLTKMKELLSVTLEKNMLYYYYSSSLFQFKSKKTTKKAGTIACLNILKILKDLI
jgi:heat shock protein 5